MASAPGLFAGSGVQRAVGERGDLRMVLNLSKQVPGPYFRVYRAQRNIIQMKQYCSAVSDLYRTGSPFSSKSPMGIIPDMSAIAMRSCFGAPSILRKNYRTPILQAGS